jgi:hypothetical protein
LLYDFGYSIVPAGIVACNNIKNIEGIWSMTKNKLFTLMAVTCTSIAMHASETNQAPTGQQYLKIGEKTFAAVVALAVVASEQGKNNSVTDQVVSPTQGQSSSVETSPHILKSNKIVVKQPKTTQFEKQKARDDKMRFNCGDNPTFYRNWEI